MPNENRRVFSVTFTDKAVLYNCFMSFVKGGGLFVPNEADLTIGERVNLLLKLPEHHEHYMVKGVVNWVTHSKRKGFGIQLLPGEQSSKAVIAIENCLGDTLKSNNPTYTL